MNDLVNKIVNNLQILQSYFTLEYLDRSIRGFEFADDYSILIGIFDSKEKAINKFVEQANVTYDTIEEKEMDICVSQLKSCNVTELFQELYFIRKVNFNEDPPQNPIDLFLEGRPLDYWFTNL